jgi:glutamine cyclotransferase
MHFGPRPHSTLYMKIKYTAFLLAAAFFVISCNDDKPTGTDFTISPEAGTTYKAGDKINVKVNYPKDMKVDSVVYQLDSVKLASANDSSAVSLETDTLALGTKLITAKVYSGGNSQDVSTNIVLMAAKAPEQLSFVVEKTFPHDTSSYTEGLEYHDGYLYESDGGRVAEGTGQSSLRKTDLTTGKILKKTDIDPAIFAEGITVVGNKIIQLTYTEKKGFVYDKDSFKLLDTFSYTIGREGWGLCFDGKKIYNTDGSNRIFFLDKNDYHQTGFIDVYDDQKPVDQLNELEYIDGKLYANVYTSNDILVIDPKTGAILQKIDMTSLYPEASRIKSADVLNGIAYDAKGKRLFVTGKKWPNIYQVKLIKK